MALPIGRGRLPALIWGAPVEMLFRVMDIVDNISRIVSLILSLMLLNSQTEETDQEKV
jgi:hypothetical protein